jgi:hypothetical protein
MPTVRTVFYVPDPFAPDTALPIGYVTVHSSTRATFHAWPTPLDHLAPAHRAVIADTSARLSQGLEQWDGDLVPQGAGPHFRYGPARKICTESWCVLDPAHEGACDVQG